MSDIKDMFLEPFHQMLASIATPKAVRAAETICGLSPMWAEIESSGFLDALVPEEDGGAGLSLADIFPLIAATGEFSLPVPFAETVVARGLLALKGVSPPNGAAIVLGPLSATVPLAKAATHALVERNDRLVLIVNSGDREDPFGAGGGQISDNGEAVLSVERGSVDLMLCAAGLTSAKMAGMMARLLTMTVRYAGERHQFGRSLSKFQAIQHQLAVMAEQVVSAHVAARIGMSGRHFDPLRVAMAKCRVSEASHQVAAIAHAVHGAIGVTEEYDLQLLTRRLKQGQIAFGSESYWAERLGRARVASALTNSVDFVRSRLTDAEPTT